MQPSSPAPIPQQEHHSILRLIIWLGTILIVAAISYFFIPFFWHSSNPAKLRDAVRKGDFTTAQRELDRVLADSSRTSTEKAIAELGMLAYQVSIAEDPAAVSDIIVKTKTIINDVTVDPRVRALAINNLASIYYLTGSDPAVLPELFKDLPVESIFSSKEPQLANFTDKDAINKLFEWSYSLERTSLAAIHIAHWYTDRGLIDHDPKSIKKENVDSAEKYLKEAEELAAKDEASSDFYAGSSLELNYKYYRTLVIGRLVYQKGDPYKSTFRDDFKGFMAYTHTQENPLASNYRLFARYFFAATFLYNGIPKGAQEQLKILADGIKDLSPTATFAEFFVHSKADPDGDNWFTAKRMFKLSPEFKGAIEKIVPQIKDGD